VTTAELATLPIPVRVRKARAMLGHTQRQLADAIGVTKLTIIRIERFQQMPRPSTVALIEAWIERNTEDLR